MPDQPGEAHVEVGVGKQHVGLVSTRCVCVRASTVVQCAFRRMRPDRGGGMQPLRTACAPLHFPHKTPAVPSCAQRRCMSGNKFRPFGTLHKTLTCSMICVDGPAGAAGPAPEASMADTPKPRNLQVIECTEKSINKVTSRPRIFPLRIKLRMTQFE